MWVFREFNCTGYRSCWSKKRFTRTFQVLSCIHSSCHLESRCSYKSKCSVQWIILVAYIHVGDRSPYLCTHDPITCTFRWPTVLLTNHIINHGYGMLTTVLQLILGGIAMGIKVTSNGAVVPKAINIKLPDFTGIGFTCILRKGTTLKT